MKNSLIPRSAIQNSLASDIDKFFDSFFKDLSPIKSYEKSYLPKINVYEKEGKYHIDALVPFAKKEDIEVTLKDRMLTISVNSHQDKQVDDGDYFVREISRSSMMRSLHLGEEVDIDSADSKFENGVLSITFNTTSPKDEGQKKLEIK